jgi:hypothetical protein
VEGWLVEVGPMIDRVRLDWRVPAAEWRAFRDYVHREYGGFEGYGSREAERAMREYIDADEFAAIEDYVDRLTEAAGRSREDRTEKNRADLDEETTRVCVWVDADLKAEFSSYVDRSDDYPGRVFARAIRDRYSGGRASRLTEKLDRVVDDAESVLAELNNDADGLSTVERRTVAICDRLDSGGFLVEDLDVAIEAVAGSSAPTLRKYRERVLDRLNFAEHPNRPDLYLPEEEVREIAADTGTADPDAPAIDRLDYGDLSREQKIRGARLVAARKARERSNGKARIRVEDLRDALGPEPTESHLRDLLEAGSGVTGYHHDSRGLAVDLADVDDADLRDPPPAPEDDTDDGSDTVDDAADRLDVLDNAQPALADGGTADATPGGERT